MVSILALFLCTVFVLFLIRLERKQSPNVSRTLWIPTIWMLSVASKPLSAWFGSPGESFESGSPIDQYFLSSLLCLGLIILAKRRFNWSRAIKENIWVILLISYMLASILWSDIPFVSFKRWVRELIAVIMAFLVLSELDPRQAMKSILKRTTYILIPFSLLLINYFPLYGRQYGRWSGIQMWIGVTTQKNGLGRLCLIAAFFLIWTLVRRSQGRDVPVGKYHTLTDVSVLLMALFLLIGPGQQYSATALASFAIGSVAFIGLLWIKKHRLNLGANTLTVMMTLLICFGTFQPFIGGSSVGSFTASLNRNSTLTGRTDIWAGLIPDVMRQPIVGSGFGSFWTPATVLAHDIGEAHNGYLDELLELGFVGLLLISMFVLSSCRKAYRELRRDFDWGVLWICFLLMVLIHNITETSINSLTSVLTAVLLFLAVSYSAATSRVTPGALQEMHNLAK